MTHDKKKDKPMTTAQRMKQSRVEAGLSQGKVAKCLGISRTAVTLWETDGPSGTHPYGENLEKCAQLYKKNPVWLRFGDRFIANNELIFLSENSTKEAQWSIVPVITWELAKKGKLAVQEISTEQFRYTPFISDKKISRSSFALMIQNDAMYDPSPTLLSFRLNELIVIDPIFDHIKNNDLVLASQPHAEEAIFRQYIKEGEVAYLKPLNSRYDMIKITKDVEIVGIIAGRITPF